MKIERVSACGFDKIYDLYQTSRSELKGELKDSKLHASRGFYMKKRDYLLNNTSASFVISDINIIELLILKKLTNKITILDRNIVNMYNSEKEPERNIEISKLLKLTNDINSDEDINNDISNYIIPVGCIKHTILCTFKGTGILAVTNSFLEKLFMESTGNNGETKIMDIYKEDVINKNLANNIIKNIYPLLQTTMYDFDQYTDFTLIKNYFNYVNINKPCVVAQVNSPGGQLDLCGSNKTTLNYQLANVIKAVKEFKETDMDYIVTIYSTFLVFSEFLIKTDFVTCYEDLKVIANDEAIYLPFEVKQKYQERINDALVPTVNFRKSIANDDFNNMHKPCLILSGQYIKFNIKIPANIEELIKDGKFDVMDTNIVGDIVIDIINKINAVRKIYKNNL